MITQHISNPLYMSVYCPFAVFCKGGLLILFIPWQLRGCSRYCFPFSLNPSICTFCLGSILLLKLYTKLDLYSPKLQQQCHLYDQKHRPRPNHVCHIYFQGDVTTDIAFTMGLGAPIGLPALVLTCVYTQCLHRGEQPDDVTQHYTDFGTHLCSSAELRHKLDQTKTKALKLSL